MRWGFGGLALDGTQKENTVHVWILSHSYIPPKYSTLTISHPNLWMLIEIKIIQTFSLLFFHALKKLLTFFFFFLKKVNPLISFVMNISRNIMNIICLIPQRSWMLHSDWSKVVDLFSMTAFIYILRLHGLYECACSNQLQYLL